MSLCLLNISLLPAGDMPKVKLSTIAEAIILVQRSYILSISAGPTLTGYCSHGIRPPILQHLMWCQADWVSALRELGYLMCVSRL